MIADDSDDFMANGFEENWTLEKIMQGNLSPIFYYSKERESWMKYEILPFYSIWNRDSIDDTSKRNLLVELEMSR